jgi:uncharacterized membrane protein YhaH (DUF805 family)
MSTVNPYSPPRAAVADVHGDVTEFSTPKVWSVSGRIGRLRYLAYLTIASIAMYALLAIAGAIGAVGNSSVVMFALMGLIYIPFIVLSFMLLIQRSHDMGWSGWTVLLALIPLVGLIWVFKAGTPRANDYGAPPPPNPTVIKVFGLFIPVAIPIIGIVAAISLPAYQSYVNRSKAMQQQQQPQIPQQQQQ